ncbi:MAG: NAD(P)-dependent oxidoreductase [Myxococcota bacterium]|nr:NAD(P)-dependent oxidoreductase [Myxococcota bacterium]
MMQIAFLCLGIMGAPMAGHLARAGHAVRVYNRSAGPREEWLSRHADTGGRAFETPADAAAGADFVMACTGRDADLREIVLGSDGAFEAMSEGSVFVDHTTVSASLARELAAEAENRGLGWLDAPISGGEVGAERGELTIMVGGEESVYRSAAPLLDVYAKKHLRMGTAGCGQLSKMVNQICIAGLVQALAEGLHFATRSGLDAERVVDVIAHGAAQSWQMDNRASTMLRGEFDFGFAVDWMRKDLGIALDEAKRCGATLSLTSAVDELYAEVQARGGSRWDTSSLIALLEPPKKG